MIKRYLAACLLILLGIVLGGLLIYITWLISNAVADEIIFRKVVVILLIIIVIQSVFHTD